MGFFSKVWNGVKSIAKSVVNTVVDVVTNPSKVWNGLTGKTKFEEAEVLLKEIEDRYDKAKKKYEKDIATISIQIEEKISKINYYKREIYDNHFARFTSIGNKIHNISINGKNFLEYFDDSITQIKTLDGVRNKDEL